MALLTTGLVLGVGFLIKDRCNTFPPPPFSALCYSDITPLYYTRHFDQDTFPYVDHGDADRPPQERRGFLEYPVLTGLLLWTAARLGTLRAALGGGPETHVEFFDWNVALLAPLALALILLVWRMTEDRRRVAWVAAGSPLALYAFHNWDLLAVFFAVLALYAWERKRWVLSGAALALGMSAKLYPALLAPLLVLTLVRRHLDPGPSSALLRRLATALARANDAGRWAAGGAATLLAINGPFLFFGSATLFWETYRFHLRRPPNYETLWHAARHYGNQWHQPWLAHLGTKSWVESAGLWGFGAGYLLVALLLWKRRLDVRQATLAVLVLVLVWSKIFSLQYALWILPWAALVPLPAALFAAFAISDAAVYLVIFPFFDRVVVSGAATGSSYDRLALAVVGRTLALVGILAWLAWRAAHKRSRFIDASAASRALTP